LYCVVLFCAVKSRQCTASAPDSVAAANITITALDVRPIQTQKFFEVKFDSGLGLGFHKQCFPSSFEHIHVVIVKTEA